MAQLGRPSSFTQEAADIICVRLADGESLRTICLDGDMPDRMTVAKWLSDPERVDFLSQYARAREAQADFHAESIIEISDESETTVKRDDVGLVSVVFDATAVARNRLRVDARKWYASKLSDKKYGSKLESTLQGPGGGPIQNEHSIVLSAFLCQTILTA